MEPANLPHENLKAMQKVVRRPWGRFTVIGSWPSKITVKILTINPHSRLSLQKHKLRDEEWLCVRGVAEVQVDSRTFSLKAGEKAFIPRAHLHRVGSDVGAEILEVAYGTFKEDDIVRTEDDYGRAGAK
jgi:mannose-6-phosphate isomerase-like protein (cupin superfamily)